MKAFLSHSSVDIVLARKIFGFLRDQPVSVWFDRIELRPGDPLISKISEGITEASFLFALLTAKSVSSKWVQKELTVALAREINGEPIRVVPLLVDDAPLPAFLADKVYIPLRSDQEEFHEVIPAVFRDSFILDLSLTDDLSLDRSAAALELYEYVRSNFSLVQVRILNRNLTSRIRKIVKPGSDDLHQDIFFEVQLQLFWTALAQCISGMCNSGFDYFDKRMEGIEVLLRGIDNSLRIALYTLGRTARKSISSTLALERGEKDISAWLSRVEKFKYYFEWAPGKTDYGTVMEIVQTLLDNPAKELDDVELKGDPARNIMDTRFFVPLIGDARKVIMMSRPRPDSEIMPATWYSLCVPQIIERAVVTAVFGAGRPIHELKQRVGFSLTDYLLIGLA
jgi:TIR domain